MTNPKELEQAVADMRAYADTLPEGSEERQEYEDAISSAEGTLRAYAAERPAPKTEGEQPAAETSTDADEGDDDEDDRDTPDVNGETAGNLKSLADQLRAEGYDVDEDDLTAGQPARQYAADRPAPVVVSDDLASLLRDDVTERVDALVQGEQLLPFEGDRLKVALYALLDATPEGEPAAGLRRYSRGEDGRTPAGDRRAAVRDVLAVLSGREATGLTRTYTRDTTAGAGGAPDREAVTLTLPDDVPVNDQSADMVQRVQAFATQRGIPLAEAVKLYEKEHGKVTLKKY